MGKLNEGTRVELASAGKQFDPVDSEHNPEGNTPVPLISVDPGKVEAVVVMAGSTDMLA